VLTCSIRGRVRALDVVTGHCLQVFEIDEHGDSVVSMALSPSGDVLLVAMEGGTCVRWDLETSQHQTWVVDRRGIHKTTFSHDGLLVLFSCATVELHLWDTRVGACLHKLQVSQSSFSIWSTSFSSDGSFIASSAEHGEVCLWHNVLQSLSDDGRWFLASSASACGTGVWLWDIQDGSPLINLEQDEQVSFAKFIPWRRLN